MLEDIVAERLFPAVGETVPEREAESPDESVDVGELVCELLTLTVEEGVCELVPDCVLVSEPVLVPDGV